MKPADGTGGRGRRGEGARAAKTDSSRDRGARAAAAAAPSPDLTPVVGKNLRRFRSERGLSLEGLSKLSGVSRAMLGQIELGHSTPTINVVWKIARALDLPFSAIISEERNLGTWVLPRNKARLADNLAIGNFWLVLVSVILVLPS